MSLKGLGYPPDWIVGSQAFLLIHWGASGKAAQVPDRTCMAIQQELIEVE